jgi:hypothetical protein
MLTGKGHRQRHMANAAWRIPKATFGQSLSWIVPSKSVKLWRSNAYKYRLLKFLMTKNS